MSPDVNRCGNHDQMLASVGKLNGAVEALREDAKHRTESVSNLHKRIDELKICMHRMQIGTIKAVNKNNLKLVALASPISGAAAALLVIATQYLLK